MKDCELQGDVNSFLSQGALDHDVYQRLESKLEYRHDRRWFPDESAAQCACERHRVLHYQEVQFGDWPYISQERIMLNLVLDSGINL